VSLSAYYCYSIFVFLIHDYFALYLVICVSLGLLYIFVVVSLGFDFVFSDSVYTIQPVEQPAACERFNTGLHESNMLNSYNRSNTEHAVGQPAECLYTRYNRLFNRLYDCIVYTNIQPVVRPV